MTWPPKQTGPPCRCDQVAWDLCIASEHPYRLRPLFPNLQENQPT